MGLEKVDCLRDDATLRFLKDEDDLYLFITDDEPLLLLNSICLFDKLFFPFSEPSTSYYSYFPFLLLVIRIYCWKV